MVYIDIKFFMYMCYRFFILTSLSLVVVYFDFHSYGNSNMLAV